MRRRCRCTRAPRTARWWPCWSATCATPAPRWPTRAPPGARCCAWKCCPSAGATCRSRSTSRAAPRNSRCATPPCSPRCWATAPCWCRGSRWNWHATTCRRRRTPPAPAASARSWPTSCAARWPPRSCAGSTAWSAPIPRARARCVRRRPRPRRAKPGRRKRGPPPSTPRCGESDAARPGPMELKPEQLVAHVGKQPLQPAYLVAGPETLHVLEAADAVRARARGEGAEREVFEAEGREPDWDALSASFDAPGLFASRRLLELRLPNGKPGKTGSEVIMAFCANPPPDVTLLVVANEWSKAHQGKWYEAVAKRGVVSIAWALKPHELPGWIERRLRDRGLRASPEAVQGLAERVEGNLLAAAQEIDKLALLAPGATLDLATMESLVADAARYDVFRLVETALSGHSAQVRRMLAGLRAEGE